MGQASRLSFRNDGQARPGPRSGDARPTGNPKAWDIVTLRSQCLKPAPL